MSIILFSDINADRFANPQVLRAPMADARELLVLSGVVLTNLHGDSGDWKRTTLLLFLSVHPAIPEDKEFRHDAGAASVALSSVWDKNHAINAGFAVDSAVVGVGTLFARWIGVECRIAVSDKDAFLYRVAYNVTVTGTVTNLGGSIQIARRPTAEDVETWRRAQK
jgi:hypothetical protein